MWRRIVGPALAGFVMMATALTVHGTASADTDEPTTVISVDDPAAAEYATPAEGTGEEIDVVPCTEPVMCFWEHANRGGHIFYLRGTDSTFHNNSCAGCVSSKHPGSNGTWGDQMSSFQNLSGRAYCFYFDREFRGPSILIPANERRVFNLTPRANDEFSSGRPSPTIIDC